MHGLLHASGVPTWGPLRPMPHLPKRHGGEPGPYPLCHVQYYTRAASHGATRPVPALPQYHGHAPL